MSDDFFVELQAEFLNEASFLLETFEENMLGLEDGEDPQKYLTEIFRVAHSVKGGASAVGLTDLGKFAHVMEDLLSVLRNEPHLVSSKFISLLLKAGDLLKTRVSQLQQGDSSPWDCEALKGELLRATEELTTGASAPTPAKDVHPPLEASSESLGEVELSSPAPVVGEAELQDSQQKVYELSPETGTVKLDDDFFSNIVPEPSKSEGAFVNEDLIRELLGEMGAEESAVPSEIPSEIPMESSLSEELAPAPSAPFEEAILSERVSPSVALSVPVSPLESLPEAPLSVTPQPTPVSKSKEVPAESSAGAGSPPSAGSRNLPSTIKVDTSRVDSVLDAVGELVVLKNQIIHDEAVRNGNYPSLVSIVDQLDKAVRELYDKTLSIRMTPLKSLFVKIQRIVRDVSITLDKPVDLQLQGEETEVERSVFELLNDPLVHLVRNAMDHGVEKKEVRKQNGKSETARVTVAARQNGGNVIIEISDDGGGISRDKVFKKAIEKGLLSSSTDPQSMSDSQVFDLIFSAGFSTAEKVSDLSGRGVGLDVVKSNLEKINGKIQTSSKPGLGTTFTLTIPLSTAITDGIVVGIQGERYILPIYSIREIVRVKPESYTHLAGGDKTVRIREQLLGVIPVESVLGKPSKYKPSEKLDSQVKQEDNLVIVEHPVQQMAIPVDEIFGQTQVVVKPISTGDVSAEVAGAAILGDGKTVLILDPSQIIKKFIESRTKSQALNSSSEPSSPPESGVAA